MSLELGLLVASTAFTTIGTLQAARAESNAAKYNAQVAQNNAAAARSQADADARRQRILADKALGGIRAATGASGVTMEGSPLDVLGESAATAALDVLNIKYKGEMRARGFDSDATLYGYRARSARKQGNLAAAGQLLSGASKVYDAGGWGDSPGNEGEA